MSEPREPNPPVDSDFLTIEDVSRLLQCAVDTVYRIRRDQLPVYRRGKRNVYLRGDLIQYVKLHCRVQFLPGLDDLL